MHIVYGFADIWLPKSRAKLGKGLDIQEASPGDELDVGGWMGKCMKHLGYVFFARENKQWNHIIYLYFWFQKKKVE